MKYYLFFILSLCISCAAEPNGENNGSAVNNSSNESAMSVDESPPYYMADICKKIKKADERRLCGDEQLLMEIDVLLTEYMAEAEKATSTKLVFEFDIETNGSLSNVAIKNRVHPAIDKAVGGFLSRTKWSPAIHEGEKVKIRRRLPIYLDIKPNKKE